LPREQVPLGSNGYVCLELWKEVWPGLGTGICEQVKDAKGKEQVGTQGEKGRSRQQV
jgi:hypothetical protein